MPTQTGYIDLTSTNAVKLYAQAGFENAERLYATKSELTVAANEIRADVAEQTKLKDSGSGTSVTLDGAASAALDALTVHGESVQDGTPTPDAPVEIQSVGLGENLLTDASVVDTTYYAKDSEGYYNINGTGWAWGYARSCVRAELPAGVYVVSMFLKEEETNAYSHFMAHASNGTPLISHNLVNAGTIVHQRFVITGDFIVGFEFKLFSTSNRATLLRVMRVESAALVSQDDVIDIRTHGRNLLTSTEDMSGNVSNTGAGSTYSYSGDTVTWTTTSTGWPYFLLTKEAIPLCVLSESDTMTLSVDLRCTSGGGKTYLQIATVGSYAKPTPRIRMTNDSCMVGGSQLVYPTSSWTRYTFTVKTDLSTWSRQGSDSDNGIGLVAYLYYNDTGTIEIRHPQLELGSTATEYEPYRGTVTPIPLQGHELRSLPDGTRDELSVDADGRVTLTQRVTQTTTAVTDGVSGTVGTDVMSSTGAIADGATVLYHGAESSVSLGTIDMPDVQDGDVVEVIASLTPSIDATWWTEQGSSVWETSHKIAQVELDASRFKTEVRDGYARKAKLEITDDALESLAQGNATYINADGEEATSEIGTKVNQALDRIATIVAGLDGYTEAEQTDAGFSWSLSNVLDGLQSAIDGEISARSERMEFDSQGLTIGVKEDGNFSGMRTRIDNDSIDFLTPDDQIVGSFDADKGLDTPTANIDELIIGEEYKFVMMGPGVMALVYVGGE